VTELLAKLFVRNHENTKDPAVRTAYGKLSGWVGIVCNVLLCAGKFLVGLFSGSVSITADAANNLSDASSSVISLIGFKLSEKQADEEHPYGHARYEYLSGLMVAMLVILIGFELLKSSIDKIIHPEAVVFSWVSVGVLAGSILMKLWMMCFNLRVGKRIDSQALLATAADSRNDVISTGAVLAALLLSAFTPLELDGWMGLLVAAFILWSGAGLVRDAMSPLLGKAPDAETVEHIRDRIMQYPGVIGTHDLMIHDYGPGRQFASVHVEMAAEADVLASHDVIDNIERDFLREEGLNMVVHYDPIVTADAAVGDLRREITGIVAKIDERLSIHDLRIVPGTSHTNVIFDCVRPPEFGIPDKQLEREIQQAVRERHPDHFCVITVEASFAPIPKMRSEELA